MKKHQSVAAVLALSMTCFINHAQATTAFDQLITPDAIFGSGNANGVFTTTRVNGIEIGLRAKIPFNGDINSSGDGRYHYSLAETDHDNNPGTDNRWNFDWTINTDYDFSNGSELADYTYELGMDVDPSENTNFLVFDPVTPTAMTPFFDHSIGNNTTPNGGGTEASDAATYLSLLNSQNVLQQSWRYAFFSSLPPLDGYDPTITGSYQVYLQVMNPEGQVLARTEITVDITNNGDVTPEVIFGSGNANGDFTINQQAGVEIGLRAKIPFNGLVNNNGDGTYSYTLAETDHDNDPGTANRWNFDWAINTDFDDPNNSGDDINDYTYELGLDSDPGLGTDFLVFDPITPNVPPVNAPFFDHAFGTNDTVNGGGTTGTPANYSGLLTTSNVVQQSWRYAFFQGFAPLDTYDPDVPGTYAVYLLARNLAGDVVARTDIQVLIAGAPKSTVPVAIDDFYQTTEDNLLTVDLASGLLINDADSDMQALTVVNPGVYPASGIGGDFTLAADGSFTYQPPADANGTATVDYQITDGDNLVDSTVTVTVQAVNDAPDFSILGDLSFNSLQAGSNIFIIDDFAFDFVFGPGDESGQAVQNISLSVVSDSDNTLNDVLITNMGSLIIDLSLNFGTAMLEINMQDDGGTAFGGDDTSATQAFSISYLDLIFANGFEPTAGLDLLVYLDKLSVLDALNHEVNYPHLKPSYHFPANRIEFLGHHFQLHDDYQSTKVITTVHQWLLEVIAKEGLEVRLK